MKKYIFIGLGVVIIGIVAFLVMAMFKQGSGLPSLTADTTGSATGAVQPELTLKPSDISIGIFDDATEPTAATKLLEKRLQDLGFKIGIVKNKDVDAETRENTTLWYRSGAKAGLDVLQRLVLATTVVRELPVDSAEQDIVFVAWNIDDIIWGPLANDALKLTTGSPETVTLTVLNAGAATGEAGRIAGVLQSKGYSLASGESADVEKTGDALVYYQRNFKDYAKNVMNILRSNGYPTATYRAQYAQKADLVVMLLKTTAAPAETAPKAQ